MKHNKAPVAVSIHRISGGDGGIRIEIEDRVSGCDICLIEMSLEQFAEAVTGLSSCQGTAKWNTSMLLKKREVKDEFVAIGPNDNSYSSDNATRDANTKRILAPYEVDGWIARHGDLWNSHRARHGRDEEGKPRCLGYNVVFIRFVEATEEDIKASFKKGL